MNIIKENNLLKIAIFFGAVIICVGCGMIAFTINRGRVLANEVPFFNPPLSLDESLLVGTWKTEYMEWGSDMLEIKSDGTFRQTYKDNNLDDGNYIFESAWNGWWIEQFADGSAYLHLEGAKYFLQGVSFAEKLGGYSIPCEDINDTLCEGEMVPVPFRAYDWINEKFVDMNKELILNIRVDSSNNIILLHLWSSSDRGFPLIGGEAEIFRNESSLESE